MINDESKTVVVSDRLKVPSNFDMVTPNSLRRLCEATKDLQPEFETKDVANVVESWTNLDGIARILAYAKYLDILNEKRIKRGEGRGQIFRLTPKGERIKDAFMFQTESFPSVWSDVIYESGLYRNLLQNEHISKYGEIHLKALEKLVYDAYGRKSHNIARKGSKFIGDLLVDAGLTELEGTTLKFKRGVTVEKKKTEEEESQEEEEEEPDSPKDLEVKEGYEHIVSPGNFEINISLTPKSIAVLKAYVNTWATILNPDEEQGEDKTE